MAQGAARAAGKIWLELGAAGFAIIAWLGWAFVRHIWNILRFVANRSKALSKISIGLTSFLISNIGAFAVATQIYGDIFVLFIIGTALGALLAMPVLADRAVLQGRVSRLALSSRMPHVAAQT